MADKQVRITHIPSGEVITEGPRGWGGIMPFEGNYYIGGEYLRTAGFKTNYVPGICVYKFVYVWLDYHWGDGEKSSFLGWKYVVPNPLFPFIWFRVAVPGVHPELLVEEVEGENPTSRRLVKHAKTPA